MKTLSRKETNSAELIKFSQELKTNGFDVYLPEGINPTYCKFVKDNNIGYVENTDNGFNFSTVHEPNCSCGTGYSIHREVFDPTVKMALACFVNRPHWASNRDKVKKYSSWENYLKSEVNNIIKMIKI